jgi:hypothetical protein
MRFNNLMLVLSILMCTATLSMSQDNFSPITDEVKKSFQNEDLFKTNPITGMSENATAHLLKTPIILVRGQSVVSGSWTLNLRDTHTSTMTLNLDQYQDAVFGSGKVIKGDIIENVSIGGTVIGDRLNLYATTDRENSLYRMALTVAPGSLTGNYLFTAPGIAQPGVVFGKLIAPVQPLNAPTNPIAVYSHPAKSDNIPIGPKSLVD